MAHSFGYAEEMRYVRFEDAKLPVCDRCDDTGGYESDSLVLIAGQPIVYYCSCKTGLAQRKSGKLTPKFKNIGGKVEERKL